MIKKNKYCLFWMACTSPCGMLNDIIFGCEYSKNYIIQQEKTRKITLFQCIFGQKFTLFQSRSSVLKSYLSVAKNRFFCELYSNYFIFLVSLHRIEIQFTWRNLRGLKKKSCIRYCLSRTLPKDVPLISCWW